MMNTATVQPATEQATHQKRLSEAELETFGQKLDALRQEVLDDLGEEDVEYIRRMIRLKRYSEIGGRGLIHFSLNPFSWAAGIGLLSFSKILENMEIGHNIMHGQYDWTNDPDLVSQDYEWDTVCDGDSWRLTHNYEHHTYTNIIGMDRDYGYGIVRLSDDIPWKPAHLVQFVQYGLLTGLFQWGVALNELDVERIRSGDVSLRSKIPFLKRFVRKAARQVGKDYVFYPLIAGPMAPKVLAGNVLANLGRNLWASTIIFCGHFTENAETFQATECRDESRGAWYYRQLLGSSNFTGGKWLHIMSGHLSYQIEHHLFPDIPAHRYETLAPKVRALCEAYGVPYNSASFTAQYRTVLARIARHSLPPSGTVSSKLKRALKPLADFFSAPVQEHDLDRAWNDMTFTNSEVGEAESIAIKTVLTGTDKALEGAVSKNTARSTDASREKRAEQSAA